MKRKVLVLRSLRKKRSLNGPNNYCFQLSDRKRIDPIHPFRILQFNLIAY